MGHIVLAQQRPTPCFQWQQSLTPLLRLLQSRNTTNTNHQHTSKTATGGRLARQGRPRPLAVKGAKTGETAARVVPCCAALCPPHLIPTVIFMFIAANSAARYLQQGVVDIGRV